MSEFKDGLGRPWTIAITCGSLKRIEEHAGFDLADISNGKAIELFTGNHRTLLPILWPLVRASAEAKSIDFDNFADALWGQGLENAIAAVKEALLDFFQPSRRPLIHALIAKMEAVMAAATEQGMAEVESARLDTVIGGKQPSTAPESSESTQTAGPSENSSQPEMHG